MTERTGVTLDDRLLARSVLTRLTHPEEIREDRPTGHDTCRKLGVAARTHVRSAANAQQEMIIYILIIKHLNHAREATHWK